MLYVPGTRHQNGPCAGIELISQLTALGSVVEHYFLSAIDNKSVANRRDLGLVQCSA